MSDYRNVFRLAREVDAVLAEIDVAETPEQIDALSARVAALHADVAIAVKAHAATRPWYSRWVWALRLHRFESLARRTGRA